VGAGIPRSAAGLHLRLMQPKEAPSRRRPLSDVRGADAADRGPFSLYVGDFAVGCTWLGVFARYQRHVSILKWISSVLLAYVAVAMVVDVA
jgi:hypothetical protein